MALTVAELQVQLEGQTKQFDRKIKASENRLKTFERTGNRATKSVGGGLSRLGSIAGPAIAALGVTVLATRLISAAKNVTAFTDAIGKQADAVGTSTAFLQEFRVAVTLTGGSVGGADKALTKLNRNLAEAAEGTGPAADAFQQLGIPLEEIQGLDLPEAVSRIAQGISKLESPAEKTAVAIDLFGRAGDKLVNTFAEGSEGLDAFRQRARDTGQVIDESLIRRAELLNDRFQLANDRLRNATIPILTDLREGMTIFAEAAVRALNAMTGLSEADPLGEATVANVSATVREIVKAEEAVKDLTRELEGTGARLSPVVADTIKEERRQFQLELIDLRMRLQALQSQRAVQQGVARDIKRTGDAARETAAVSRFEFFTEEQAAAEAGRIEETFRKQQEVATIREEAIGDELRAIEAVKKAAAAKDKVALDAINEKIRKEEELRDLRLNAAMSLIELEQTLAREAQTRGDPLRENLADIQDQIRAASEQAEVVEDPRAQQAAANVIGTLTDRRAEVTREINELEMANAGLADLLAARAEALLATDRARAITLQEQLDSILAQQLPLEETQRRLRDILTGDVPEREDGEAGGNGAADRLATAVSGAFFQGLEGGLDDFGGTLLETVINATGQGTKEGFESAEEFITDSLSKGIKAASGALSDLFGGEGGGVLGKFGSFVGTEGGQDFLANAIGFGAKAIQGFRQGADIESSAAGQVASAVTSVQRVRGIVAGPTNVAVAQVDRGIRDAFVETNFILRRIEENTRSTAIQTSDTGTGSVPTGGTSEATQALANESPAF